jgi:hypothetical protein
MQVPQLLTGGTATSAPATWGGGSGSFDVSATWNGATVSLQRKNLDGTFTDVAGAALTATGRALFTMPPGQIRAAVTGGPPANVNAAAWRTRS